MRVGAAWVYRQYIVDESLFDVENDARAARRGIWGLSESEQVEPWNWRRGLDRTGAIPDGCNIKGNINSKGDHIYHSPGGHSYGATKIDESKDERWFVAKKKPRKLVGERRGISRVRGSASLPKAAVQMLGFRVS